MSPTHRNVNRFQLLLFFWFVSKCFFCFKIVGGLLSCFGVGLCSEEKAKCAARTFFSDVFGKRNCCVVVFSLLFLRCERIEATKKVVDFES
jgi:hypothetical protein